MAYLVDTSVLLRLVNTNDLQFDAAFEALKELSRGGERLCVAPQVLVEFRNAATRPRDVNGLGLTATDADSALQDLEATFELLDETPRLHVLWRNVVGETAVLGKQVHDARLVAICRLHQITHVLTFNAAHFLRLAGTPPNLIVVDPRSFPPSETHEA